MTLNKHLTLSDRIEIENALSRRQSFKQIAKLLGKDPTTISKEVKRHRVLEQKGAMGHAFNNCALAFSHRCQEQNSGCPTCHRSKNRYCWSCGLCRSYCEFFVPYSCPSLLKPPYVCNGCKSRPNCALEKMTYHASQAQASYEDLRSSARSGFAITEAELAHLDAVISPLLKNGQSLHHIAVNNLDETMTSERTLYTYVNSSLFAARNIDMPRTVRMRPRKTRKTLLKVDRKCRVNRTWQDFQSFMLENPYLPVRQLDSVEGKKGSAVLLTIHFVDQLLQLAFLRQANDAHSVAEIFNWLYETLGDVVYRKLFPVLLADNGSEFSNPTALEMAPDGSLRSHVFYCDPNAPFQKGSCENNHELIRRCIPKGVDLAKYSQTQITLMMSHINSYTRASLGDKSPYEVFAFQYGKEILEKLGIKKIPANEVNLTPALFKK